MDACMLHYYTLKHILEDIPEEIRSRMEYDDNKLFNYSTFNDLGIFFKQFNPFKRDKYDLKGLLHSDKFYDFIIEYIISLRLSMDFDSLLFLYAIYSHKIMDEYVEEFLSVRLKTVSKDEALNLLDYYYAVQNENFDISKNPIGFIFIDSFDYTNEMNAYIKEPLARVFGFFNPETYFFKCMNRKRIFYTYLAIPSKCKKICYAIWSKLTIRKEKKNPRCFLLNTKKSITPLINGKHVPYVIGNNTYTYSFDEIMKLAIKKSLDDIKIINDYLFYNKDKQLRQRFNIDKKKEL